MSYDIIIKNGLYFDGSGAPGVPRHIGIRNGKVDGGYDPRREGRVIVLP